MPDDMVAKVGDAIRAAYVGQSLGPKLWDRLAKAAIAATDREELVAEVERRGEMLDEAFDLLGGVDEATDLRGRILGLAALKGNGNG